MKKIIGGIIVFVICVCGIVFNCSFNTDTKQDLKEEKNKIKVEEVSTKENDSVKDNSIEKSNEEIEEQKTEKNKDEKKKEITSTKVDEKKKETISKNNVKKEQSKVQVSENKNAVSQVETNTIPEKKEEQQTTENTKPVEQQTTQNTKPVEQKSSSCGIYQSITNCKYDYDSSSACYSAGEKLNEMYLNDWMDYNEVNPNNPISREIQNTECYSVDTDNGVKWYLSVVCYNGSCSKNYKSIYLGK